MHLPSSNKQPFEMCNMKWKDCFYYDIMYNKNTSNNGFISIKILQETRIPLQC